MTAVTGEPAPLPYSAVLSLFWHSRFLPRDFHQKLTSARSDLSPAEPLTDEPPGHRCRARVYGSAFGTAEDIS